MRSPRQNRRPRGLGTDLLLCTQCIPLVLAAGLTQPVEAQQATPQRPDVAKFSERVETVLSEGTAGKGHWGILVADADSGEVLFSLNPAQYFTPASNTKLFTTVLALATLGSDHRVR